MTTFLGIVGFIVVFLIAVPATLIAFIKVMRQPANEIIQLWTSLADLILDIYEKIKNDLSQFKK
jgi:hypothetical protein